MWLIIFIDGTFGMRNLLGIVVLFVGQQLFSSADLPQGGLSYDLVQKNKLAYQGQLDEVDQLLAEINTREISATDRSCQFSKLVEKEEQILLQIQTNPMADVRYAILNELRNLENENKLSKTERLRMMRLQTGLGHLEHLHKYAVNCNQCINGIQLSGCCTYYEIQKNIQDDCVTHQIDKLVVYQNEVQEALDQLPRLSHQKKIKMNDRLAIAAYLKKMEELSEALVVQQKIKAAKIAALSQQKASEFKNRLASSVVDSMIEKAFAEIDKKTNLLQEAIVQKNSGGRASLSYTQICLLYRANLLFSADEKAQQERCLQKQIKKEIDDKIARREWLLQEQEFEKSATLLYEKINRESQEQLFIPVVKKLSKKFQAYQDHFTTNNPVVQDVADDQLDNDKEVKVDDKDKESEEKIGVKAKNKKYKPRKDRNFTCQNKVVVKDQSEDELLNDLIAQNQAHFIAGAALSVSQINRLGKEFSTKALSMLLHQYCNLIVVPVDKKGMLIVEPVKRTDLFQIIPNNVPSILQKLSEFVGFVDKVQPIKDYLHDSDNPVYASVDTTYRNFITELSKKWHAVLHNPKIFELYDPKIVHDIFRIVAIIDTMQGVKK